MDDAACLFCKATPSLYCEQKVETMQILISPAKKLDETPLLSDQRCTQARLLVHAQLLIDQLQQLTPDALASLMKLSPKLALLNTQRFSLWQQPFQHDHAKAAIYLFKGDVYQGLDADSLSREDIDFAQQHLRILSGLYGYLRPLDLMLPYRLEMGTTLSNARGKNLYAFWGSMVAEQLRTDNPAGYTINLA